MSYSRIYAGYEVRVSHNGSLHDAERRVTQANILLFIKEHGQCDESKIRFHFNASHGAVVPAGLLNKVLTALQVKGLIRFDNDRWSAT